MLNRSLKRYAQQTPIVLLMVQVCMFLIPLHAQSDYDNSAEWEDAYELYPRDTVKVSIFGEPDLETEIPLDANGTVKLPLIGKVKIAGLTLKEAETLIERAYIEQEFLRKPQVTIIIEEYTPRTVSVLGNVASPGKVTFPIQVTEIDIIEVISQAGGFDGVAQTNDVRVTRVVDGNEKVFKVDVGEMIEGDRRDNARSNRFMVYPGDVVFVPERFF